jgi:hypothetical protein
MHDWPYLPELAFLVDHHPLRPGRVPDDIILAERGEVYESGGV